MAIYTTNEVLLIYVHEFVESFFPSLMKELQEELGFTINDAKKVSENVILRLKSKFKANKPQSIQVFRNAIAIIVVRETNKFRRLMDKNFGFSQDSFNEMVIQLKMGDERVYEKVFISHFNDCMKYLKNKYKASHQDAYDASMKTMVKFCQLLKEDKVQYGNLRFLFTQMSAQHYMKWIKRQRKLEPIDGIDMMEELPSFDKDSLDVLDQAFAKLGEVCSKLLKSFYHNENQLKEIAAKLGKPDSTIRKQKQRCLEKLRGFYIDLS